MIALDELETAARNVYCAMLPTPQHAWPLLGRRAGCEVWVKHENHTPIGAFKVRGGLNLLAHIVADGTHHSGIISATRGNHGQSLAFAAARHGVRCVIVVPRGNSLDKNAAMQAFGAELIEYGRDFDEAREHAAMLATLQHLRFVGPFDRELVAGVGSYALELFRAVHDIDTVYVPIGLRLGHLRLDQLHVTHSVCDTEIVGVVSTEANTYALSFAARSAMPTSSANTMADGMAVRVPVPAALDVIVKGAARIVQVSDAEVEDAMRAYYSDTHQLAEGAGAAPLAALLKEGSLGRRRVAIILTGGNIDRELYARVLCATL